MANHLPEGLYTRLSDLRETTIPKKLIFAGIGFVVFLLVLWLGVPRLLDGTRQGRAIASELANTTGLRVRIEGAVNVSIFPHPRLSIENLTLLEPDGQTAVLTVPRLDLRVSFASLFRDNFSVQDIAFINPKLHLRRLANGQLNWQPNADQAQSLSVRHISVSDGEVTLDMSGHTETVTALDGDFVLPNNATVFRTSLTADWRDAPLNVALDIAAPIGRDPSLASLKIDVGAAEASLHVNGTVETRLPQHPLQAQLDVTAGQAAALFALGASLGLTPEPLSDTGLQQNLTLTAALDGGMGSYSLKNVDATLGDLEMRGSVRVQTTPRLGVSLALKTNTLDLAQWPSLLTGAKTGAVSVPKTWLGAFDLGLSSVKLGDVTAEAAEIKGDVTGGVLRLSKAKAVLPGESHAELSGTLTTAPNTPAKFDGDVSLETVHLRDLLTAFKVTLPQGIADNSLRQTKLTLGLQGEWQKMGVPEVDVTLDGIHLTGQIAPQDDKHLYNAHLALDSFDLSHYGAFNGLPAWVWSLPPSNLDLAIKQLRFGDQTAENVSLQATLLPNILSITSLDTADFGGNRLRLVGTYSPLATIPSDLTLNLTTADFPRMKNACPPIAALLPPAVNALVTGAVDASVRWRKTDEGQQRLTSLHAGDSLLDLVVSTRENVPTSWKARLRHPETALLLKQLAPNVLARPDVVLGAVDAYAEGTATPQNDHWQISAIQGQVAGLLLRGGALDVVPAQPLQVTGNLTVSSGNLDLLQQTLKPLALPQVLTGNLTFALDKLSLLDDPLTEGSAALQLGTDGTLTLSNFTGKWRGGSLTLKGAATPQTDGQTTLKGETDVRGVAVSLPGGDRFSLDGLLDLGLRFTATGSDHASLIKTLEGDGEFTLDSGHFGGLDLTEIATALKDHKPDLNLPSLLAQGGTSDLSSFGGNLTVEDGIAKSDMLRFRTPAASADVKASLDLTTQRLDATTLLSFREVADAPPLGLSVNGALSNLTPTFTLDALSAWLGKENKPDATNAPTDKQPEAPVPPTVPTDKPDAKSEAKPDAKTDAKSDVKSDVNSGDATPQRPSINKPTKQAAPKQPATTSAPEETENLPNIPSGNDNGSPPSIEDILKVLPKVAAPTKAAVEATRGQQQPAPKPKPKAAPTLAPEFQNQPIKNNPGIPEITITMPDNSAPPASLEDLVKTQPAE